MGCFILEIRGYVGPTRFCKISRNREMGNITKIIFIVIILLCFKTVYSNDIDSELEIYKRHFSEKVTNFSRVNRLNSRNINRDRFIDCYMLLRFKVVIAADGTIKNLTLLNPSPLEVLNKYHNYIITQSAPFDPLRRYFTNDREDISFVHEFRMDMGLYQYSIVTKPCVKGEEDTSKQASSLVPNEFFGINKKPATIQSLKQCNSIEACMQLIKAKIERYWRKPENLGDYEASVIITFNDFAEPQNIFMEKSSGHRRFDTSLIQAIEKASPFSELSGLNEKDFSKFKKVRFLFKPE